MYRSRQRDWTTFNTLNSLTVLLAVLRAAQHRRANLGSNVPRSNRVNVGWDPFGGAQPALELLGVRYQIRDFLATSDYSRADGEHRRRSARGQWVHCILRQLPVGIARTGGFFKRSRPGM